MNEKPAFSLMVGEVLTKEKLKSVKTCFQLMQGHINYLEYKLEQKG